MRYLITTKESKPALTHWFEPDNHFNAEIGMVVYDLFENKFTTDGYTWQEIIIDHL